MQPRLTESAPPTTRCGAPRKAPAGALLAALALAVVTAPAAVRPGQATEPVTVFAAASLTDALQEIARAYHAATGVQVRLSFAASSTLARQIEAGAPADIFASANERWMDELARKDLIEPDSRTSPIANRLVLIAPGGGPDEVELGRDTDLAALLGADGRLAVGDPDHVPAGLYARQALQALGQWDRLAPRLARADNTRAALALVERGEAPLGIVYATDAAITPRVRVIAIFPADSHAPISYPFALVKGSDNADARAFFRYLTGAEAGAIFARFGFAVAGRP